MRSVIVALVVGLAMSACGGEGMEVGGFDAGPEVGVASEACNRCEDGYRQVRYYPSTSAYCEPTGDARLMNPCRGASVINWGGGGVVECSSRPCPVDAE